VAKAFGVGRTTLYRSLQRTGEVAESEVAILTEGSVNRSQK
jgi:DNA-binding phage protein